MVEKISMLNIPSRTDDWDVYFQSVATVTAIKSKDPKCQVGAVIVSRDHLILSTGFNGLARGVEDSEDLLADGDEKIKIICHAEANAIANAARLGSRVEGATIYVTKFPCLHCCNLIVQAGIKRIYTHDERYWNGDPLDPDHTRKRLLLQAAGVKVDAPFHPDYSLATVNRTRRTPKKPAARMEDVGQGSSSEKTGS